MDMPYTHQQVQEAFTRYAQLKRADAEASLLTIVDWREQVLDRLNKVTLEFLLTGIVDLPTGAAFHEGGPKVFNTRDRSFSWTRYVRELARDRSRPFAYIVRQSEWASACAVVSIQKQKYTLPLAARFLLLEKRNIMGDTRRWNFIIPRELAGMIDHWRADCATDPALRKALRLYPEYRPTL